VARSTAAERRQPADEAVTTLLRAPETFQAAVQAASEVDGETAQGWVRELCAALAEQPESLPELESLVALGLSHPELLEEQRVQPKTEGRRLAVLLCEDDRVDRAIEVLEVLLAKTPDDRELEADLVETMRRAGREGELIDEYLHEAQRATRAGRSQEAIRWCQAALAIDRSRRDAQRMIRDLRFQDAYRSRRFARGFHALKRVVAFCLKVVLVLGAVAAVGWYDVQVRERYAALAPADYDDLDSVRRRLADVDGFIGRYRVWTGALAASRERGDLRGRLHQLEGQRAEELRRSGEAELLRQATIDSALVRARIAVSATKYEEAIEAYETALELAGPDWDRADAVRADVEAIRAFTEEPR